MLALAAPAAALSLDPCPHFVPGDGATFPANAAGFRFTAPGEEGERIDVELVHIADDGTTTPVEVDIERLSSEGYSETYSVVPRTPFMTGRYRATIHTGAAGSGQCNEVARFNVVDAAPLPTTLGTLTAAPAALETRNYFDYERSRDVLGVSVETTLVLSEEARPWASLIDTGAWSSYRSEDPNVRNASEFASCDGRDGTLGPRTVRASGRILGLDTVLESNEVVVDLDRDRCPAPPTPPPPESTRDPSPDAGTSPIGMGLGDDVLRRDSGCGCRTVTTRGEHGGAMLAGLSLIALAILRRRRRA